MVADYREIMNKFFLKSPVEKPIREEEQDV